MNKIDRKDIVKGVLDARNEECQIFRLTNQLRHTPLMPYDVDITYTETSAGVSGEFTGSLKAGELSADINIVLNAQNGESLLAAGTYYLVYNFENGSIYLTSGMQPQEISFYEVVIAPTGTIKSVTKVSPYYPADEFQAVGEQVEKNTTAIAENKRNINLNKDQISQISTRVQTNSVNISKNATAITEVKATVEAIDTDLQQLEAKVETNTENISQNTADIGNLETWKDQIDPTITAHTNAIGTINDNIATIQTKNTQQDTRLNTAETNITANTDGITAANNRIDGIIAGGAVTNYPTVGHITLNNMYYTSDTNGSFVEDATVKNVNPQILKIYNGDSTEVTNDELTTVEGEFEIMPTIDCIIEILYVSQNKANAYKSPTIYTGTGINNSKYLTALYNGFKTLCITEEIFNSTTSGRYGFVCKERIYVPANQKVSVAILGDVSGSGIQNLDQVSIDIIQAVSPLS